MSTPAGPSVGRFAILGATGDLTGRMLLPALAQMLATGGLPADTDLVAVAHSPWDTARFRQHATEQLARHAADVDDKVRARLVARFHYLAADVTDAEALRPLREDLSGPLITHLALPSDLFEPTIHALSDQGAVPGSRLIVEKPFGTSEASARQLNELLHERYPEKAVFRMDHFLGKQTVQNVLGARFANRMMFPIWNREHIERVDIVVDETVALEGRARYYDRAGALRDMVQNHLLQLLCLVAMEEPARFYATEFRAAKVRLLDSVRIPTPDTVTRDTVRARYTAGQIGSRSVPDYTAEEGVDPARDTETFCAVTLFVDNDRFRGVPFRLRTGKALGDDRRFTAVTFRPVDHPIFEFPCGQLANRFTFVTDEPDRLALDIALNGAGDPFSLEPARLEVKLAAQDLSPYARLLLDAFDGNPVLSISGDEAELCWRIVEPILATWAEGRPPMRTYPAGSAGPEGG